MKNTQEFYSGDHPLNREWQITTRQLANYLRVTGRTLATWRKEGRIPYWKIGQRVIRLRRALLSEWVEGRTAENRREFSC